MTFHIHTEDVNRPDIMEIVSRQFPDGFTVIPSIGSWQGKQEASLTIEIATNDRARVYDTACLIRDRNAQESVLIESSDSSAELV